MIPVGLKKYTEHTNKEYTYKEHTYKTKKKSDKNEAIV